MKKTIHLFGFHLMVVFIIFATGISFGQDRSAASERKTAVRATKNDYRIGNGDILEIVTWKEPDFSRDTILVRMDGKISFPLLGDIHAAGLTPLQVKNEIETRLKEFVENPMVTVTVSSAGSQKFYIIGEVTHVGEYALTKNLSVLQAFALAGGFTQWASKKEIILMRIKDGKEQIFRINYKDMVRGKNLEQNVKILADDTIIVP